MSKLFIGRLNNDEFVLNHNGVLIRAELASLPKIKDNETVILECKDPLSSEQYEALKEAWDKFKIKQKSILLEGTWEIKVISETSLQ